MLGMFLHGKFDLTYERGLHGNGVQNLKKHKVNKTRNTACLFSRKQNNTKH